MKVKAPDWQRPCNEIEKQELIAAARRYIGTPWQHMGRSIHGLDCAGLLIAVVYDVLNAWVEVSDYSSWPNPHIMREICNKILMPIKREDLAFGDVALLYAPGWGVVHLGWFTGRALIHANNDEHVEKVVETTIHPGWNLRGAYTVPRFGTE